jgi:hypothetical protein
MEGQTELLAHLRKITIGSTAEDVKMLDEHDCQAIFTFYYAGWPLVHSNWKDCLAEAIPVKLDNFTKRDGGWLKRTIDVEQFKACPGHETYKLCRLMETGWQFRYKKDNIGIYFLGVGARVFCPKKHRDWIANLLTLSFGSVKELPLKDEQCHFEVTFRSMEADKTGFRAVRAFIEGHKLQFEMAGHFD